MTPVGGGRFASERWPIWIGMVADLLWNTGRIGSEFASVESAMRGLGGILARLHFKLDQHRIGEILEILSTAKNLLEQNRFEEKARLCLKLTRDCEEFLHTVRIAPTRLSIEELLPAIERILKHVKSFQDELYRSSAPVLNFKPAKKSFSPDPTGKISLQVSVTNRSGCAPAEGMKIIIQDDEGVSVPVDTEIAGPSVVRGGEEEFVWIYLNLPQKTLDAKAFSFSATAIYTTSGNKDDVPFSFEFPVRLVDAAAFQIIPNPYASIAESGPVENVEMFYGRKDLIENIANIVSTSPAGKAMLMYGQKRAGKSSILYHLSKKLQLDSRLLVVDLGNIATIMDSTSTSPFHYHFLYAILSATNKAARQKVPGLGGKISIREFLLHPAPLIFFKEAFLEILQALESNGLRGIKPVILVDEFTYLYEGIVKKQIEPLILKNIKAFLQAGYFSAVFVGQDVTPKFQDAFPNELGTMQEMRITYLSREDAIRLSDDPIRIRDGGNGESRYLENAIDKVLEATAGNPYYIVMLCNHLVEYMNVQRTDRITKADIAKVIGTLISGSASVLEAKFDNLLTSGDPNVNEKPDARIVLNCIAKRSEYGHCCHVPPN